MGKTYKRNSDDFHKKFTYENRNKNSDCSDFDLIEDIQSFDYNERQNRHELHNDTKRRK